MSLGNRILSFTVVGMVFAVTGCAALEREPPADPRALAAVVVNKNDPPPSCRPLGDVAGDVVIGSLDSAKKDLIKNAVAQGGNYVALEMTERHPGGYGVSGRLFQCPSGAVEVATEWPKAPAPPPK